MVLGEIRSVDGVDGDWEAGMILAAGEHAIVPADQAAIRFFAQYGGTLCTLIEIQGSYSCRLGAQLAISKKDGTAGVLGDQCLENELITHAIRLQESSHAECLSFGSGIPIDFRLACGSTIKVLVDPNAEIMEARNIVARLDQRLTASLILPDVAATCLLKRRYVPALKIFVFGEGAAADALARLGQEYGIDVLILPASTSASELKQVKCDSWSAVAILSHEHEWERALLPWALQGASHYVGAIGGEKARQARLKMLQELGVSDDNIARLHAPLGLIPSARHPSAVALSALSQIVAHYEDIQNDTAEKQAP